MTTPILTYRTSALLLHEKDLQDARYLIAYIGPNNNEPQLLTNIMDKTLRVELIKLLQSTHKQPS